MTTALSDIIDFSACPVSNPLFARQCAARLASDGILILPGFLLSGTVDMLVAEAEAKWDAAAIQADIDLSIARRILVRGAHGAGQSPSWDYFTPSGEEGRWCRTGSDYNDWSFNVI